MTNKYELREWLSIAPADIPIWIAGAIVIVMYYVQSTTIDIGLSVLILGLTVYACIIGMRYDERISKFSNIIKKLAYPACVLLGAVMVYLNFAKWNG